MTQPSATSREPLILDSITQLPPQARQAVAYCASHGGLFSGALALQAGLRGILLCDAGVGLGQAGIASLALLQAAGVPAAAIGHRSARIGDGRDGFQRGLVSHANAAALALGIRPGDRCAAALAALQRCAPPRPAGAQDTCGAAESREILVQPNGVPVVLADSNSLVEPADAGRIVVCGSHGGLLGGDPGSAVRVDVRAIAFNDADGGADLAGHSRLPALDRRGIAAVCVSAWTARIGDARSSYETGVISALNEAAARAGAGLGMPLHTFLLQLTDTEPSAPPAPGQDR